MNFAVLIIAEVATQPVGETPAERVLVYAIGAVVTVMLAWIAYLHARTSSNTESAKSASGMAATALLHTPPPAPTTKGPQP